MAHPIYSRQQLLNRGMVKVKKVAADLGVLPTGDKRLIQSWVDAIVNHQAVQVQKVEIVEATIDFDGDSYEGLTKPYVVLVNGEVVHRTTTYQLAERHCKWQGYTLVDTQEVAQQELGTELEVQATEATAAITEESRISFISPSDFGYYEAILDGNVNNVVAKIEYDDHGWNVEMTKKSTTLTSHEEAEEFIKDQYVNDDDRGSGCIEPVIEDINMIIEHSNFVHDFGQSYTLRVHGALAGDIFLDDDHGWTINGEDYQGDWRPVAKELIGLTRRELVAV